MTDRHVVVDHVLFVVADLEASRRLYTAALAPLGIADRYYAAFVSDLHRNNVEAVYHSPAPILDAPRRAGVP